MMNSEQICKSANPALDAYSLEKKSQVKSSPPLTRLSRLLCYLCSTLVSGGWWGLLLSRLRRPRGKVIPGRIVGHWGPKEHIAPPEWSISPRLSLSLSPQILASPKHPRRRGPARTCCSVAATTSRSCCGASWAWPSFTSLPHGCSTSERQQGVRLQFVCYSYSCTVHRHRHRRMSII